MKEGSIDMDEKEDQYSSSSSRPSIGFPLGLALLLILLFCISGFFVCYINWQKLRALISGHENDDVHSDIEGSPADVQPQSPVMKARQKNQVAQSVPVLMPGDEVPRFIAMACPCEPPIVEKKNITIAVVQKPPPLDVPFYYS